MNQSIQNLRTAVPAYKRRTGRLLFFLVAFVTGLMRGIFRLHDERTSARGLGFARMSACVALLSVLAVNGAYASHYRYGNISWNRTDDVTRTVTIKVTQAYKLDYFGPVSVGSTVNVGSLNYGDATSVAMNMLVTSINTADNYFIGTFSTTKTFSGTQTDYLAFFASNARFSSLMNNGDQPYRGETLIKLVPGNLGSPVSTLPPVINVPVSQSNATFAVPSVDPDNTTMSYVLSSPMEYLGTSTGVAAPGLSINALTGEATFNTVGKTVGQLYNGVFTITDAAGSKTMVDFIMKIVGQSTPPAFDYNVTPANNTVYAIHPGDPVTFTIKATDADNGDLVTITGAGIPGGASFTPVTTAVNPATTTFSWTPTSNQLGLYVVTFVATDNQGVQSNFTVTFNVSTGPVFTGATPAEMPQRFVATGTSVTDVISAANPDNSILTRIFSSNTLPAGALLSPTLPTNPAVTASTTMNWTPTLGSWGQHTFTFTAKDANNQTATRTYYINANTAPQFTSTPVLSSVACQPYSYTISGFDVDTAYGDELEFESHNILPSWLTLVNNANGTATLSGTPTASDVGTYNIELMAADIYHHAYPHVEQNFTITVAATNVTVTNGGNVCTGTNAVFTINGPASNVVTYNINNNANTTVTLNGSGVATVSLSNTTGPQTLNLVSLANTATNCTQTITGSSTVTINPVPTGSANPQTICSGSTSSVALNSSIGGGTFTWTAALQSGSVTGFANCTATCGNTIAQTLTNTGTGSGVVRYTVTPISPASCPGTPFTVDVTVNAQPVANAGPDKIICGTGDALQANAAVAPQTGAWSIISGTSTSASQFSGANNAAAVFSPAVNPGTYTLKWTLSNAPCASSSDTVVITTLGSVQGTITASSNANVCSGQTSNINISVNPVSGGTFSGTFTNGKTFTNLAPAAGIISPSYTFTNNGITNTTESFVLSSLIFTPNTSTQPTPSVCNATAQAMGGQTLVTIQPVSDIAAVVNGGSSKCNGTAVVIDVTNPNSVGGSYNRTAVYNGVTHTGPANGAGQSFNTNATFTETLTNNTSAPVNVVYTFTPVSPGSQGCVGIAQSVTVTVNPSPNVVAPANQLLCNNVTTSAINFNGSVTGTTFAWTNDNANIGLAASGTGSIAGFTALNTGTTNAVANISVVPSANGCTGTAQNFTITVKPTPTVVDPADQTLCNGSATAAVNLTGSVSGTVFNWSNDHTSTGLAASGTATIPSFNAANSTAAPVVSNVIITPVANGCTGAAQQMAITVNPTPVVDIVANDVKCNGAATTAVQFTGAVSGTTYTWTSDNTTIGIAASGNGDISSFTATNSGTTPVVATVTVTPHANNCNGTPRTFTITVNPTPTVASVNNQTVCNGANTSAVSFTGNVANTAFNWTNTNNTIGLASGGTGNIAAFAGTNTGATITSGTITVTPVANSCSGTAANFSVTVNPTPVVNNVTNQVVCNNAAVTAVAFTGAVSNTVYNWTNTQAGIGLAASGTGDIATFNAMNTGTTPVVATIQVTPVANNCTGTAGSFTITVNPTPTVVDPADQVVCNGSAAAAVTFTGAVSNTTYNWTNDNTAIGLAASGTTNIATFTAVNNGTTDAVAHIQVTPVANGCTGAAETFTVTVHPSPAFAFSVNGTAVAQNGAATICQAAPTTFAVSGATANSTFTMTHNGNAYASGAVNGAGTFTHSFVSGGTPSNTTAGTYVLSVTDAVTGCVAAHTYTINVNPKPTDTFKVNGVALVDGQTSTHCEGSAIQFALAGASSHSYVISKGATQIASGSVNTSIAIPVAAVADAGTYTVVLTDDNTGCTATRSYQIVVNPLPVYSFAVNSTTLPNAGTTTHCSGTAVAMAVTGDNGATYTLSHNGTPVTSGSVNGAAYNFTAATGDAGAYLLTVTSSLGCVRSSTYNMNINVAPAFTAVPANATANTATGTCSRAVTYTAATAIGTPAAAMTYVLTGATTGNGNGDASGHVFNKGVTLVKLTAANLCGSKDSTFTVTVNDNEQPVFTSCPATVNAYAANNSCGNTVATVNPAYTDNCTLGATPLTWTMSGANTASGTGNIGSHVFNTGTTAVAYTVTDASGNTAVCNYSVVVVDTVRPLINCVANITRNTDANTCGAVVTYNAPTSSDNCAIATTVQTTGLASGATFPRGTTVNTFVVTDASGNTATCSFNVTVNDAQGPAMTPPAAQTLNVGSGTNCQVIMPDYRSLFTIVDNCSGTLTIEQLAPNQPGSLVIGYGGTRTVKVKATDVAGNISIDSFTLNLVDATAPTAICKNITIDLNAAGTASITPAMINNGSHDNCSAITLSASKLSFNCSNVGANTVVLTATDASGNSATCNATVTVHDITAPVVSCWGDTTLLKSAQCTTEIPDMTYRVNATDACGVATVTQSPVAGTIIGAFTQNFPITLTVTDVNGNASNCSFNVNFADHTKPTFVNFPANIVINNGQDSCGKKVTWTAPVATDNCNVLGAASLSTTHASGTVFPLGTTTVTYTAIDQAGNDSIRSFTVTVVDAQAPVIAGCPANVLVNTGAGATSCNVTASWTEPTATDNCTPGANLVWTKSHLPGAVFPVGTTTVSYTATDASGNVSNTCSFNVIVTDNTLPVLAACPANITVYTGTGATTCGATATWTEPTATDNCTPSANLVWTKNHNPGDVFTTGTTTVTYTATDASGNASATCSFNVTVIDNTVPVLAGCPATVTVNTGANAANCQAIATWNEPTATDNCSSGNAITWTKSHTPGSVFSTGTTIVTYTATDAAGNVSTTCSFNVVVTDNTAPVLAGCPANVQVNTGAGATSCGAVATWTEPTATDNCTPTANLVWTKSHTPGTVFNVGTTTVTYTATDASGNVSAACSFNVVVTDNTAPVFTSCPSSITNAPTNAAGCNGNVTTVNPVVTDNCNLNKLTWTLSGATSGTSAATGINYLGQHIFAPGTTTVTYTAMDAAGNTNICSYTVTVVNTLVGNIGGTSTVSQNVGTTSNVVFLTQGGNNSGPYTFTYTMNGGAPQTITTTGVGSVVTIPQSNAVLGTYTYALLSVTNANGCTAAINPVNDTAVITVIPYVPLADLNISLDFNAVSFNPSISVRPFNAYVSNFGAADANGVVTVRLTRPSSAFTYSLDASSAQGWTLTPGTSSYTLTSNSATIVPAGDFQVIHLNLNKTGAPAVGTSSVNGIVFPAAGETNTTNNSSSVNVNVSQ
ncbi:MAG: HYR domain-containing protein [Sphingobacteriales bacterium]|nr:MAG: HYR domain-containing protein [Sphingobacteriales bacterium]